MIAPVVTRVSGLYRSEPHDRSVVVGAVDRFWRRVLGFGGSPSLLDSSRSEASSNRY